MSEHQADSPYRIGPAPGVLAPRQTLAWLIRELDEFLAAIEAHRPRRGAVIVRAREVHAEAQAVIYVTGGRRKVDLDDVPTIQAAHQELQGLLGGLVSSVARESAPSLVADVEPTPALVGDVPSGALARHPGARLAPHLPESPLMQRVLAERQQLPLVAHPWWPFSPAARRVRAWCRVRRLADAAQGDPRRVVAAWDAYATRWIPTAPVSDGAG